MRSTVLLIGLALIRGTTCQDRPKIQANGRDVTIEAEDVRFRLTAGASSSAPESLLSIISSLRATRSGAIATADTAAAIQQSVADLTGRLENVGELEQSISGIVDTSASHGTRISMLEAAQSPAQSAMSSAQSTIAAYTSTITRQQSQIDAMQSNISALQPTEDAGGTGLPRSCREIISRNASAASGRYRIRPSSDLPPVAVYCDHDFYGGGWSLVQKISTGNWQTSDTSTLHRQALDPLSNTNQARLYDTSMAGDPFIASLNRAYTNGIARYSASSTAAPVVRVDFINCASCTPVNTNANEGTYMQTKTNAGADFDYWMAMRDATLWGDGGMMDGNHVAGFGEHFRLAKNPSSFNPARNTFLHDTCGDGTFGAWWRGTTEVQGFGQVSYTRHGGLVGDGHCHQGNQWLVTYQEELDYFMSEGTKQSLVYLR